MKKLLVVLISVLCIFTLVGCGSKEEAAAPTGDDVVTIKVGGSGPLTGGAAVYGLGVYHAAQIAVDEINATDTKIKFELKFEDDEAAVEKATTAYGILYDWGMQISMFTVTSGSGSAVAGNYDEDQIFAITPSGSSTELVYTADKNYKGNFQMCFTDPNQGVTSADYIADHFAGAKVAIIYRSDDVYSTGIFDKFKVEAANKNVEVVYEGGFIETDTDFNTQLKAAQAAGADLVYMPIYYQPASLILAQAKALGYAPTFFGVDGMDGILDQEGFDKSLAEGLYQLTPFDANSTDEKTAHFVKAFQDAYGETPNQFAADAYDCIYAMHQALENIGAENINDDTLYEDMIKQFTTMTFNGTTGENMTWSENGEVSKMPKAVIIKDGVYTSAE